MTLIEIVLSASSAIAAAGSLVYVAHIVRISGRERPYDPARAQKMVDEAPLERLGNVLSK